MNPLANKPLKNSIFRPIYGKRFSALGQCLKCLTFPTFGEGLSVAESLALPGKIAM